MCWLSGIEAKSTPARSRARQLIGVLEGIGSTSCAPESIDNIQWRSIHEKLCQSLHLLLARLACAPFPSVNQCGCNTHFRCEMAGCEIPPNPHGTNPVADRFYTQRQAFTMGQQPLFLLKFDRNGATCNTQQCYSPRWAGRGEICAASGEATGEASWQRRARCMRSNWVKAVLNCRRRRVS
jgi:hypothetical protein